MRLATLRRTLNYMPRYKSDYIEPYDHEADYRNREVQAINRRRQTQLDEYIEYEP